MGYQVKLVKSTLKIDKKYLAEIGRRFIELNKHDDIKRVQCGDGDCWFSGMDDWNPEKDTVKETLEKLSFTVSELDNNLSIDEYNGKLGQEGLFFYVIGEFITGIGNGVGEDGEVYKGDFDNSVTIDIDGYTSYEVSDDYTVDILNKIVEDGNHKIKSISETKVDALLKLAEQADVNKIIDKAIAAMDIRSTFDTFDTSDLIITMEQMVVDLKAIVKKYNN